jgi:hypothetical protein
MELTGSATLLGVLNHMVIRRAIYKSGRFSLHHFINYVYCF